MSNLTAPEVAARLRMSVDSVRRLCKHGDLVGTKVGRQWLVSEHDLDAFESKHRGGSTPPTREPRRGRRRVA